MRKPFVAGNWKMNKTVAEGRQLVSELVPMLQVVKGVDKVLCPPFTSLLAVAAMLEGSDISLGAQNMHWEKSGAFTGEISPVMLVEFCQYVILGHSERRAYFGETDDSVNAKIRSAFEYGLIPIVCVGETLEENKAGRTFEVVSRQIQNGLRDLNEVTSVENPNIIAYEPVWAIGTGLAATAEDAVTVIADVIRPALSDLFGKAYSEAVRVLYGGSVKGNNAGEFFAQSEIDGALVGGASLDAKEFAAIVQAAS